METWPRFDDRTIVAARPAKTSVDPRRPYTCLVEPEHTRSGHVVDVATIFLTNRECPFRCLMCDLWMHTTDTTVPAGAIPAQITYALERLPTARHVKLYNSGNFFDRKAVPPADYRAVARAVDGFENVIVENHPKLCDDAVPRFRDLLRGNLEVALGLETVHPAVLDRLNKRMTLGDFERAVSFLRRNEVAVRAFILLKPPFMDEQEGIEWALRSMAFAFDAGVECCSIIPTRAGNGIMQQIAAMGFFAPPRLSSMERVLESGLGMERGRVFVDLWEAHRFYACQHCGPMRTERLHRMNLSQRVLPPVTCPATCCPDVASPGALSA